MKAIVSVIGKDKSGIIAKVSTALADNGVNIEDISQTIVQGNFTMMMVCDLGDNISVSQLAGVLDETGKKAGVVIRVQHEDIFNAMHTL